MQISNAIAWGHLQLKGGWRNVAFAGAGYLAIIGGLILVSVRVEPLAATRTLNWWMMGLMVLQIGILLIYGCWAISSAIRKDASSRMIDSHRLMPVSGTDAVAGYILGPGCQAISMGLLNILMGLVIAPWGGVSALAWIKANYVLGIFAGCCWIVVAFLTLTMPVGSRVIMGLVWVLIVGHQGIAALVPGLSILIGPALGVSVFGIVVTGVISSDFQVSMIAQLLVALLCYAGAARRYRREDVLSWGPIMGLAVLAAYVAISLTGLSLWEAMKPRMLSVERYPFELQLIFAAMGAMWAGVLPVCAATWLRAGYERRRALNDPAPNPRPAPIFLVTLAAAMIASSVLPLAARLRWDIFVQPVTWLGPVHVTSPVVGPDIPTNVIIRTILIFVAFLTTVGYTLRIMYRSRPRSALAIVLLFVLALWIGPLITDFFANQALHGFGSEPTLTALSGCSPPMTLAALWARVGSANTTPGIAIQCAVAALLAVIYHATEPRRHPQALPVSA